MPAAVLAIPVGLLIGLALGGLGAGGSMLAVPALVFLLGQDPHQATTIALAIVGATALVGGTAHWRAGRVFGLGGRVDDGGRGLIRDPIYTGYALWLAGFAARSGRCRLLPVAGEMLVLLWIEAWVEDWAHHRRESVGFSRQAVPA